MQALPDIFVWPCDSCGLRLEEKLARDLLDSFCASGKLRAFSLLLALNTGTASAASAYILKPQCWRGNEMSKGTDTTHALNNGHRLLYALQKSAYFKPLKPRSSTTFS